MSPGFAIIAVSSVRREVHDEVFEVLEEYEERGWRLRRQGHKFYFYCPCGNSKVRIDGTPRNPSGAARRIRRELSYCPERHTLES